MAAALLPARPQSSPEPVSVAAPESEAERECEPECEPQPAFAAD